MRYLIAPVVICALSITPASAQEEDSGLGPLERGALLLMEGILKEMEPAIEEFEELADKMAPALKTFADEMGPKLAEILNEVEDWTAYQPPEMLPNGDIIIRRKPDTPLVEPETPAEPAPQIDL